MGQRLRGQQRRLAVERIDQLGRFGSRPAAGLVDGAKAVGDQQPGFDALAFENGVGGNRRPVHQRRDVTGQYPHSEKLFQGIHDRVRRVRRVRRHLRHPQFAAVDFERDQIGKRPARVDPDHPRRHGCGSLFKWWTPRLYEHVRLPGRR